MKYLDPTQAHELLEQTPDAAFVDVRSEQEFADGHPAGSINVPLLHMSAFGRAPNEDFVDVMRALFPDTDKAMVLTCRSGGRSAHAGMMLEQLGYKDVYNVDAGWAGGPDSKTGTLIAGWADRALPSHAEPQDGTTYREIVARLNKQG